MLSLYVHLPWCVRKCPYCDFNSYTAGEDVPRQRYVRALVKDIAREATRAADRALSSVFLGGGTPSFFPPEEIAEIIDAIQASFVLDDAAEITMEANPGTVESGAPAGYRQAGINRLSLGAQSFDTTMLERLGRLHSVGDIERSVAEARGAGFDNLNIDVMFALPGQSVEQALADLDAAAALEPEHLSWYQLTMEPNTVFHARPPAGLPDGDVAWDMQLAGQARLAELGFRQYEVSAYAKPNRECRHNRNYWEFGDYLAVGAGAHGKVMGASGPERYQKPANPLAYMAAVEADEMPAVQPVAEADRPFEFMLMATRLVDGFDPAGFEATTGLPAAELETRMAAALEKGLLERTDDRRIRPTGLGRRFLNDLQAGFLPG
ncbi:MAG: radical SAM family heme chaperone HemW [Pseudomonadota bacterium]